MRTHHENIVMNESMNNIQNQDASRIQALAVFSKRACHIVKHSPHNMEMIIDDTEQEQKEKKLRNSSKP